MNKTGKVFSKVIAALVLMALCIIGLNSCKSQQAVVSVPKDVSERVVEKTVEKHDSIYLHDSIFVSILQKGDTIFQEKTVYRTKYVSKPVIEKEYVSSVDTVNVPYEVEKKLTKLQSLKIKYGGFAFIISGTLLLLLIYLSLKHFKLV